MTDLRINVDTTEVLGLMSRISDNLPRARTLALNRTGEEMYRELRQEAASRFIFRPNGKVLNWYAPPNIPRHYRATDTKPIVSFVPERAGDLLRPFETGTPRFADRLGRPVAMPTYGAAGLRTSKSAILPKELFPVNLGLQVRRDPSGTTYYALGRNSIKRKLTPFQAGTQGRTKGGKLRTFELPTKASPSKSVVLQRLPGGQVRALWIMKQSVARPKLLTTYETARRVVAAQWGPNMAGMFRAIVRSPAGRASLLDLTV